jgi:hypothetical protein
LIFYICTSQFDGGFFLEIYFRPDFLYLLRFLRQTWMKVVKKWQFPKFERFYFLSSFKAFVLFFKLISLFVLTGHNRINYIIISEKSLKLVQIPKFRLFCIQYWHVFLLNWVHWKLLVVSRWISYISSGFWDELDRKGPKKSQNSKKLTVLLFIDFFLKNYHHYELS